MKYFFKKDFLFIIGVLFIMEMLNLVGGLEFYHNMIYDNLYESSDEVSQDIVIVGIDDLAYQVIGRWPFSREVQSEIFNNIMKDHPQVLGVDILYDSETNQEEDDQLMASLDGDNIVIAEFINDIGDVNYNTMSVIVRPFDDLNKQTKSGFINSNADELDGIVRKAELFKTIESTKINSFSYEIYKVVTGNDKLENNLSEFSYIDYVGKPKSYDLKSAAEVYNGEVPSGFFEDKIVLFGPYTMGMQDDYFTPMDKQSAMFGIEIHANILQNLLDEKVKKDGNALVQFLLILFVGCLSYLISKKTDLIKSIFINILLIVFLFIFGWGMYKAGSVYAIIYPVITILFITIFSIIFEYFTQLFEKRRVTGLFGRYVSPQIVDEILKEGKEQLGLGGIRRDISVLFVDIRGFTPMSEAVEPEVVVEILNEYLELCSNAIFNTDGTLDKFIGDATMAIFNAPLDLKDHEFKALQAAMEMKTNGEKLAIQLSQKYGKEVRFGIGINSGPAIVGNIGSKARMDYTAIGDTVNIAARLESNAKPGQILISEATYERVKERVMVKPLGKMSVKGKKQELNVFQLDEIISTTTEGII